MDEKCKRCNRPEYIRGLCVRHYGQCEQLVQRRLTSWGELEDLKLINPRKLPRYGKGTSQTEMYLAVVEARGQMAWYGDFI